MSLDDLLVPPHRVYGGLLVGDLKHECFESEFLSQEDLEGMFCHGQQLLHLHVVLYDVDLLVLRVEVLLGPLVPWAVF